MANQSIGTPRFYLDFTQLAKAKGYVYSEDSTPSSENIIDGGDPKNVWNFDYTNPTNYTADTSNYGSFTFKCPPFWSALPAESEEQNNRDWARLMSTVNYGAILNHNLRTKYVGINGTLAQTVLFYGNSEEKNYYEIHSGVNYGDPFYSSFLQYDGYTIFIFNDATYLMDESNENPEKFSQFGMRIRNNQEESPLSSSLSFDIGAITFGKYIDMPNSPDLNVKKTVEYDGVNIKRSLGGSDLVQINHQGQPDWLVGEPWALKDYASNGRVGRNGRRSWDLSFSYISNDDLFYDLSQNPVGTTQRSDNYIDATNEIQLIWDLSLGGALSFIFCPDKDADNPEFAVCRLDQDSLVSTQVAYQTWNISMRVVEVW